MSILVTGAAGYIGSIVTEVLLNNGCYVIGLDNLQQGHSDAVSAVNDFVEADLCDRDLLDDIFKKNNISTVIHMAADTAVEHSMSDPRRFFYTNVVCGINLLDSMLKYGVGKIVFSSTAAVYGVPERVPIVESDVTKPLNAYGESKLMLERILRWYSYAYGQKYISLRYFNAAGASESYGEHHVPETHLIPNVLNVASEQKDCVQIFGTDYNTEDGTCVRDYIHVSDIAEAHLLALRKLDEGSESKTYNLGNGDGYSVKQIVDAARKVTGLDIVVQEGPRRSGDPAILIADSGLIRRELGWQPKHPDLEDIITSAWKWHQSHPNGYSQQ
ncbi:UDP-glucose 4-epimerase GalE [Chloroflexota bacterium]